MADKGPQPNQQVLSRAPPTEKDATYREWYLQCIKHTMEDEKEGKLRESVLVRLDQLPKNWIREEAIRKGWGGIIASEAGGRLFTSGSYRMGVHGTGDDIDVILVAPRFITSADFFDSFYEVLCKEKDITEIHRTPSARQPIISLTFLTIELDLQLASLPQNSITRTVDIFDPNILRGLDPTTIRTLSGPAVADKVLRFVPKISVFRELLRGIKAWARARGIYSSRMSYMGGVALAVLTARVCQLYPNALSFTLLFKFFGLYSSWFTKDIETRKNQAIYITSDLNVADSELAQLSWDGSKKPRDAMHIFPVITPALPYQNTCAQVTRSSLKVICDEFARGNTILKYLVRHIESQENPTCDDFREVFPSLFEETEFFVKYKYFLRVSVSVKDTEIFQSYASAVESRLGTLLRGMEKHNPKVVCHLYPRSYTNDAGTESFFYIGMDGDFGKGQVDLRQGVQEFKDNIQYMVKQNNYPLEKINDPKLAVLQAQDLPESVLSAEKKERLSNQMKKYAEIQESVELNKTPQKRVGTDTPVKDVSALSSLLPESVESKRFKPAEERPDESDAKVQDKPVTKDVDSDESDDDDTLAKALALAYGD